MVGYLPKEVEDSKLNKSVLRAVWTNKVIVGALGVKNENEAREWFRLHPEVYQHFYLMECELQDKITELQERAYNGLREMVVKERGSGQSFEQTELNYNIKQEH